MLLVVGVLLPISLSFPQSALAQYGSYGCSNSGGSCHAGTSSCTDGGVVPNPSNCDGLPAASCVSASFSCQSPDAAEAVNNSPQLEDCGIRTAIGCIPVESEQSLASFLLQWGMGIGGGIALILMATSTFSIMTSAGDPRKMQAGKETFTAAAFGLVTLVASAFLLKFIGVDILGIFGN